jgi:hypothetical protein
LVDRKHDRLHVLVAVKRKALGKLRPPALTARREVALLKSTPSKSPARFRTARSRSITSILKTKRYTICIVRRIQGQRRGEEGFYYWGNEPGDFFDRSGDDEVSYTEDPGLMAALD